MIFVITPFGIFLSTPSARRATHRGHRKDPGTHISIHALREEGDLSNVDAYAVICISIHALREEGDSQSSLAGTKKK